MKKEITRELQRISSMVGEKYKDRLTKEENITPTVKKIAELAYASSDVPQETKDRLHHLEDAGYFDRKEAVVDPVIQKKMEREIEKHIGMAIAAGRIPEPKNNTLFDKYIKKCRRNI